MNFADLDVNTFTVEGMVRCILCGMNQKQIENLFSKADVVFEGTELRFSGWDEENEYAEYTYCEAESGMNTKFSLFISDGAIEMAIEMDSDD
jgi:hypothetical protein